MDEAAALDEAARAEAAVQRVKTRLDALTPDEMLPPPLQPRGVALAAMLVAATIRRANLRDELVRFARAGAFDPEALDLLPDLAHIVLHSLSQLGIQEELLDPVAQEALAVRARMMRVLQYHLDTVAEVEGKLDLLQRADVIDLPRDLRLLSDLYAEHFKSLSSDSRHFVPRDEQLARVLALRIEEQTGRIKALAGDHKDLLMRAWTLLAVYYADVTRAARYLFREAWVDLRFPENEFIPRNLRTQPIWNDGPRERESLVIEHVQLEPIRPAPTRPAPNNEARAFRRLDTALHVTMGSESNFFMGLTENLSEGGLFVATHQIRPVGSKLSFAIFLPGSDEPICVDAIVQWIRTWSSAEDAPPGFGVRFDELSPEESERMRQFMEQRAPLFHDQ